MILETLQQDEHVFSGLIRSKLLSGQRNMGERRWFKHLELARKKLHAQAPFSDQCTEIVQRYRAYDDFKSEHDFWLEHTTSAAWVVTLDQENTSARGRIRASELTSFAGHRGRRFCAECAQEEREALGFSYWHSSHHLFGAMICAKHKTPLFTHNKLDKHDYSLPQHWIGKAEEMVIQFEWQLHWQSFIYQLCEAFKVDLTLATRIKQNVFELLEFDRKVTYYFDKERINTLFKDMHSALGENFFVGMIGRYANGHQYVSNPLWLALYEDKLFQGVRSPIYWLVTIFWLREKLSTLDGVINHEWHSTAN